MASPQAMGAYYKGHPDPDDPSTWGKQPDGKPYANFKQAKAGFEAKKGPPPTPDPVPGPASPGAGMPAARLTDLCAHGGVITAPGCPTVLIGYLPAARVTDMAVCPMFDGVVPHVSGLILKGSNTVLIGGLPAARVADPVGPPANCKGNQIAMGCTTVMIGDSGGGGGGGGSGGSGASGAAAEAPPAAPPQTPPPETPPLDPGAIAAAAIEAANQMASQLGSALTQLCEGASAPGDVEEPASEYGPRA